MRCSICGIETNSETNHGQLEHCLIALKQELASLRKDSENDRSQNKQMKNIIQNGISSYRQLAESASPSEKSKLIRAFGLFEKNGNMVLKDI